VKVIGYLRVSTRDQDYGIEVQRTAIAGEAERRGWDVQWIVDQGETGKNANRPGLNEALALLNGGEADALVVSKLDRLSRSVVDFGNILRRATRPRGKKVKPWGLVALDMGIDMTTPDRPAHGPHSDRRGRVGRRHDQRPDPRCARCGET